MLVEQLTETLKVRPEELPDRVGALLEQLREAQRDLARLRQSRLLAGAADLARGARDVFGVAYVGHHAPDGADPDDLRQLALQIRAEVAADRPAVVAVAAVAAGRPVVVVTVNERGREWNLKAGALARVAAEVLGGGGGGKDDVAQGGGVDPDSVDDALARVEHAVGEAVTGGS